MERLTIDEAIEKYKDIANTDSNCPRYCMRPCDECVQECGQVAEWLEELKDYRDKNKLVVLIDCKNIDEIQLKIKEVYADGYNNAIDDFSEKISLEISESIIWGMLVDSHKDNSFSDTSDKIVGYMIDTVKDVAEQLKEGGEE